MRNLTVSLVVAIALMGGFYSGFKYEKSKAPEAAASPAAFAGTGGTGTTGTGRGAGASASPGTGGTGGAGGAGGFGGRGTFGQVESVNGSVLTLKDAQGNEVKVQLQPSTTITKTVTGSASDLAQGVNVTVTGQRGSDGSVTATAITIVPAGAGGGQRPGG